MPASKPIQSSPSDIPTKQCVSICVCHVASLLATYMPSRPTPTPPLPSGASRSSHQTTQTPPSLLECVCVYLLYLPTYRPCTTTGVASDSIQASKQASKQARLIQSWSVPSCLVLIGRSLAPSCSPSVALLCSALLCAALPSKFFVFFSFISRTSFRPSSDRMPTYARALDIGRKKLNLETDSLNSRPLLACLLVCKHLRTNTLRSSPVPSRCRSQTSNQQIPYIRLLPIPSRLPSPIH
ncbi:hypothetical protein LY76DRAFT_231109 [Colletotrichum caudatum]|nr:hypothetical protein LY76DRAFT_231109 [Colletotrichum caudatum]